MFTALDNQPAWSSGSALRCGWEVSGLRPGRIRTLTCTCCSPGLLPSIQGVEQGVVMGWSSTRGGERGGSKGREEGKVGIRGRLGVKNSRPS